MTDISIQLLLLHSLPWSYTNFPKLRLWGDICSLKVLMELLDLYVPHDSWHFLLFFFFPFIYIADSFSWPTHILLHWPFWEVWVHFTSILSQGLMSLPFKLSFYLVKKCDCWCIILFTFCQPLNLSVFYILLVCEELGQIYVCKCVTCLLYKFKLF